MPFKTITVGIAEDAIEKISKATADRVVEELIWNSIDAEATKIEIKLGWNMMGGIDEVKVSDNGHGIDYAQAELIFQQIGGSPKRLSRRSPTLDRPYHGKEGEGRYKAFALGRKVEWHSRTASRGMVQSFTVEIRSDQLRSARIDQPIPCDGDQGCDVVISDLRDGGGDLKSRSLKDDLVNRLAPYLIANKDVQIIYDGTRLDVEEAVLSKEILQVKVQASENTPTLSGSLRVIEWKKRRNPALFLCDEEGIALDETTPGLKEPRFSFTAYLCSRLLRDLHEENTLGLGEMEPRLRLLKEASKAQLKGYFRKRLAQEAATVAQRARKEGTYPYPQAATSAVERAERQVFDICAATVHQYLPDYDTADKETRRFTYRLLREALEQNSGNVGVIFKEVLKLTEEQQADLVYLLQKTSFGSIIHASKTIADRLAFINGLEQILHENTIRKHIKERKQLQRILVEELWLFGDEFALGADDVSLRTVLKEHLQIVGHDEAEEVPTASDTADLTDIPDLVLWRQFLRGRADQFENLVIELKRPTVRISLDEIQQVHRYAGKIMNNRYFDKQKTHWIFIVISDDIADDAVEEVNQRDRKQGHVTRGRNHDVYVKRWSEVIHEAKLRLNFLKEHLDLAVEDNVEGQNYIMRKYPHLFPVKLFG